MDRLTLEYLSARPDLVLDIQPQDSSFVVREVPVKDIGNYVVTAWKDGRALLLQPAAAGT